MLEWLCSYQTEKILEYKILFYNDEVVRVLKRYGNPKYYVLLTMSKIYTAKTDKTERRNRQIYKCNQRFKLSTEHLKMLLTKNKQTNKKPTTNHFDLIFIYRTLQPTTAKYTIFLSVYRAFTKTDHTFLP